MKLNCFEVIMICVCVLFFLQGGKKGKSGEGLLQWDSERDQVLQALVQLLQLDIRCLWSLSLVEEEFIRYSDGALSMNTSIWLSCLH